MLKNRWLLLAASLALVLAACGGSDADTTTASTPAPQTTTQAPSAGDDHDEGPVRKLEAPVAAISVDGDVSDWAEIDGLEMALEAIEGEGVEPKTVTVKAAHDNSNIYVLLTVDDDYDWVVDELHLTGSLAVMWAIVDEAGPHMGTDAEDGEGPSMGMVDIWHWELQCEIGKQQGGAVGSVDDAKPGNDPECNFDDEFATDPEERYDDGDAEGPAGTGAENSLLGVFTHTNPVNGSDGTWIFEMSRLMQTGDSQDAQLTVGSTALMALAYWDADNSPEGWDDAEHVQSSNQGWIEMTMIG